MEIIKYTNLNDLVGLLKRPTINSAEIEPLVNDIIENVKANGDKALKAYTLQFDKVTIDRIKVSEKEISEAANSVSQKLKDAIAIAKNNIEVFHKAQLYAAPVTTTMPGVTCWQLNKPIQNIGIYIPGGSAPLFSTVLMLAVPALIAGCKNIILCSPPNAQGCIHPAILYTANLCGVTEIYKVGGAQAIAAMACGTESIPAVDKIFGPGNQFVTVAKQLVQKNGVAIDMPAGPSELLVLADETAEPAFVAADLLSQAEHGADSQVVFISLNEALLASVMTHLEQQLLLLPRMEIAQKSLVNARFILVNSPNQAVEIINHYAPEHLIIVAKDESYYLAEIYNAGSIFIGNYTPESAGDYASGTNHTLPTNGYAKAYGGVSMDSFIKKITCQKITERGLENIAPTIEIMAESEGLFAHKNAVSIRINKTI